MSLDPAQIYKQVTDSGEAWADAKAAYELLSDMSKTILSDIQSNFMSAKMTKSEAEMRALASGEYKNHLAAKAAARKAWLLSEVKYKGVNLLAELRRSEESSRRAEMGMR